MKERIETIMDAGFVQRAEPKPFMITRIKAGLQRRAGTEETIFSWISRPVFAVLMAVLLLINIIAFFSAGARDADNRTDLSMTDFVATSAVYDMEGGK